MKQFQTVARVEDIPSGSSKIVELEGRQIAIFNVDGAFRALDNTCPHRGGPLGEGYISGHEVTCPWHAWTFDIHTGQLSLDPTFAVKTFDVQVEDGEIRVAVTDEHGQKPD